MGHMDSGGTKTDLDDEVAGAYCLIPAMRVKAADLSPKHIGASTLRPRAWGAAKSAPEYLASILPLHRRRSRLARCYSDEDDPYRLFAALKSKSDRPFQRQSS